ncbi:hypothetical protein L2E82_45026 [Cichorium intybus]|uniref:Uncharacterized protein n=1 Tax=Cichorium intybus TaxID=13427 RepID=A0ACB8ZRV5_CICIN|nr:hypothetical protein L2E82_45026 [Cichorium intybus]
MAYSSNTYQNKPTNNPSIYFQGFDFLFTSFPPSLTTHFNEISQNTSGNIGTRVRNSKIGLPIDCMENMGGSVIRFTVLFSFTYDFHTQNLKILPFELWEDSVL